MKYFYDGCDPNELKELIKKGCIRGVTTNVNFVVNYAKANKIQTYFEAVKPCYEIANEYNSKSIDILKQENITHLLLKTVGNEKFKENYQGLELIGKNKSWSIYKVREQIFPYTLELI